MGIAFATLANVMKACMTGKYGRWKPKHFIPHYGGAPKKQAFTLEQFREELAFIADQPGVEVKPSFYQKGT